MSLKPIPILEVPEETARIAHAAFPKGNIYLRIRDRLGVFLVVLQKISAKFKQAGRGTATGRGLNGLTKQRSDELLLCLNISFACSHYLPLPNHMHHLISSYCPPGR